MSITPMRKLGERRDEKISLEKAILLPEMYRRRGGGVGLPRKKIAEIRVICRNACFPAGNKSFAFMRERRKIPATK